MKKQDTPQYVYTGQYYQDQADLYKALTDFSIAEGQRIQKQAAGEDTRAAIDIYELVHKDQRIKQARSTFQKSICIAAACILLLFASTLTVFFCSADVRDFVLKQITNIDDDFMSYNASNTLHIPTEMKQPQYVPAGFIITGYNEEKSLAMYVLNYQNSDKESFSVIQQPAVSSNIYDSEDIPEAPEEVMVGSAQGLYWEKEGVHTLIWITGQHLYTLMGSLNKKPLLSIATSI